MTKARQGEVWLARTPRQPQDPHQPRPVLIVSENIRNGLADDVLVVPIFSRGRPGPTRVPVSGGEGGLDYDSMLFCDEVTCLHEDFLGSGPLSGPVPTALLDQTIKGIRRALGQTVL